MLRFSLTRLFKSKVAEQAVLKRILDKRSGIVSTLDYTMQDAYRVNEVIIEELIKLLAFR